MIKVKEAIIVEGKYDKIKLSSFIDATIITTNGFRIFKDKSQVSMIRKLAQKDGILILTDSDSAGFIIRNYIKNIVPNDKIKQAYVPDIFGKEKRKEKSSKEGKLGVEGIDETIILDAIIVSGATIEGNNGSEIQKKSEKIIENKITKLDFFEDGLSGSENSKEKRLIFTKYLNLPEYISTNALLDVTNRLLSYEEYKSLIAKLFKK